MKWWKARETETAKNNPENLKVDLLFVQKLFKKSYTHTTYIVLHTHTHITYIYFFEFSIWFVSHVWCCVVYSPPIHFMHSCSDFLVLSLFFHHCYDYLFFISDAFSCIPPNAMCKWFLIIFGAQLSRTCKTDRMENGKMDSRFTYSRVFLFFYQFSHSPSARKCMQFWRNLTGRVIDSWNIQLIPIRKSSTKNQTKKNQTYPAIVYVV